MSTPEATARQHIDAQLTATGWKIADSKTPLSSQPTALCDLSGDTSRADYILYLDEGTQTPNQPSINKSVLSRFPVLIPPLAEQHQIVAEVESRTIAIDHLEAELDRQLTRSKRLRQSTLATAFSGKLVSHRDDDHHHDQHQKAHA